MNQTKSKVIALLMVIPLLLILTITSVVEITKITVNIPVSKIEITGEDTVYIDLATQNNNHKIVTELFPHDATNQNVVFSSEKIDGQPEAKVKINSDGTVTALSAGVVRIVATADGGRSDSVQLNYYMSKVSNVSGKVNDIGLKISDRIDLHSEEYLAKTGTIEDSVWTSSDPDVIEVTDGGLAKAVFVGNAVLNGTIRGKFIDPDTGVVTDRDYNVVYNVSVAPVTTDKSGISFMGNGLATITKPSLGSNEYKFTCTESMLTQYGSLSTYIDEEEGKGIKKAVLTEITPGVFTITTEFNDSAVEGETYAIEIRSANAVDGTYVVTKIHVLYGACSYAELNGPTAFRLSTRTSNTVLSVSNDCIKDYIVKLYSDNSAVATAANYSDGTYRLQAKALGDANIWAEIIDKSTGGVITTTEKVSVKVVDPVEQITLSLNSKKHGLEDRFALAGRELVQPNEKGEYDFYRDSVSVESVYSVEWSGKKYYDNATLSNADVVWNTSDENIATVEDGMITLHGDGEVVITVSGRYNEELNNNDAIASFTFVCKKNAVWIKDYYDLMYASENDLDMVLYDDIMLAPILAPAQAGQPAFTDYRNYLDFCTGTMHTTQDDAYYRNNDLTDQAKIRYSVKLNGDLYGNGRYIDGQYITKAVATHGYGVYNGPLDLVRLSTNLSTQNNASVKAQDNVVFLVEKDDINISNVELKGCSDSALIDSGTGEANLSNLDKVGTVLEIMGDRCSVNYSRVNNGRTVVRVYGSAYEEDISKISDDVETYRIHTEISNCILTHGREFILKVGTNQMKKNPSKQGAGSVDTSMFSAENRATHFDDANPHFTKADGSPYPVTGGVDQYFYDNYVLTDITLRDTVFTTAGLFCIGFEARFGGLCLHGYDYSEYKFGTNLGWHNVAGTSYPARIKMEGDVRFYDWKKISSVNSETLIENGGTLLKLNVSELIENNNDKTMILESGGEKYVNGAIAFYGGGKNYSYVETSSVSSAFHDLSGYSIKISHMSGDIPEAILYSAAGIEDFRFLLYDNTSPLNYQKQLNDIGNNQAYSWVERKK